MKKKRIIPMLLLGLLLAGSCKEVLEPKPTDLLTSDLALNEPRDVESVRNGMYTALRNVAAPTVIAGDFMADMLVHNGTFTQYQELGNKQVTSANESVRVLWQSIYNTIYIANFILERLPAVAGVPSAQRQQVLAEAHFCRGYAYFIGANTYGAMPLVTSTDLATNRNIARSPKDAIMDQVLSDYQAAADKVPAQSSTAAFANTWTVKAALARYYLYKGDWAKAEQFATEVIASGKYPLVADYADLVTKDFTQEAILEVGYTLTDDPGTSTDFGLNNLFIGRREIIPSNRVLVALNSNASGDRVSSVAFDANNLKGNDNGWTVQKYGTADQDNNNIVLFRTGEMYLIRAEARARQGNVNGPNSAEDDINQLRTRANAVATTASGQAAMLLEIERERVYELAFEGHRWYDLVRTGRADVVMGSFSPNWKSDFRVWPVPLVELQNNPALAGDQNPGY